MRNLDGDYHVTDHRGRPISFNFCVYAESTSNGCSSDAFAFMKEGPECKELTSSEPQAEVNDYVERTSPVRSSDDQEGIRLVRAGGATCDADSS